jgi:alpha-1,3/alpha-1,6-mannosyltransferase
MQSGQPRKIINFYRSPLKFAEYLPNDVIKHDNTGLKGEVSEWVRTNLVDCDSDASSIECLDGMVGRINLSSYPNEKEAYAVNKCDVMISAIGYERNPLPTIVYDGIELLSNKNFDYDDKGFIHVDGKRLEGLQGCGIAFPQRVLDVDGTPELSVGFWKFIRYIDQIISTSNT